MESLAHRALNYSRQDSCQRSIFLLISVLGVLSSGGNGVFAPNRCIVIHSCTATLHCCRPGACRTLGDRGAGVGERCQFFANDVPGCTNAGKARLAETGARRIAGNLTRICGKVVPLSRFRGRFIQILTGSWAWRVSGRAPGSLFTTPPPADHPGAAGAGFAANYLLPSSAPSSARSTICRP
jgi:hypothetical protein